MKHLFTVKKPRFTVEKSLFLISGRRFFMAGSFRLISGSRFFAVGRGFSVVEGHSSMKNRRLVMWVRRAFRRGWFPERGPARIQ